VIRVVVDDLAFLQVDAILRPADAMLDPVTPAMSRLDRLAGERFAMLRRVTTPLEVGAAVVTGGGELAAPYVLHVVIRDPLASAGRDVVRRALASAWQRCADWGLTRVAAPLVGAGAGQLTVEEAATLLAETFPREGPAELHIVVERYDERELVEAIVGRKA
jgi:O-acetyl-ADP-ribose deacetylase (regulator of RNase III)